MTLSAPEEGQPPTRTVGGARCHTVDRLCRYLLRVAPVGVWPGHVLTGLRRPADRTFEVRSHGARPCESVYVRAILRLWSARPSTVQPDQTPESVAATDWNEAPWENGSGGPDLHAEFGGGRGVAPSSRGRASNSCETNLGFGDGGKGSSLVPRMSPGARRTVSDGPLDSAPNGAKRPRSAASGAPTSSHCRHGGQTVRGRRRRTRPPAVAGAASPSGCRPAGSATPPPAPPVSGPHRSPHTRTPPSCLLPRSKPSPLHPTKQADWGARGSQATPRDAGAKCGPSGSVATGLECEMSA